MHTTCAIQMLKKFACRKRCSQCDMHLFNKIRSIKFCIFGLWVMDETDRDMNRFNKMRLIRNSCKLVRFFVNSNKRLLLTREEREMAKTRFVEMMQRYQNMFYSSLLLSKHSTSLPSVLLNQ